MSERISAIIASLKEQWDKASRRARIIFVSCVAGILALALVLTIWLNHKTYVVLFNDLTMTENAQVIAALNEAGIPYDVKNGVLLVEDKNEANARLQLAVLGFQDVGFNYDIANSGGLTATEKDKQRTERFGLQNRLQATLELFPEVSNAVVTISMPEKNAFALQGEEEPPSASVTLTLKQGRSLKPEQVRGIVNIVRDSVPGLEEQNISIVDAGGRGDLKASLDLNEDFNNKKLSLTQEVNLSLQKNIATMVEPPYGAENVRVIVMTALNTDSSVRESTTYQPLDPENPRNNPTDYEEYDRQKSGDGFPAAGGVPGAQDNVGTPQYAAQEAEAAQSDYYSSHDIIDYLVSNIKEQIVKDGFVIEKANASILINATSLPDGERDQIIALASNASGIPPENITVQNIKFASTPGGDQIIDTPSGLNRIFVILGIALLAFCVMLIIILMAVSRRNKARLAAEAEAAEQLALEEASLMGLMGEEEPFEPIQLAESPEQKLKLQIKDLAESDPEIVAQLIKTWLLSSK